MNRFAENRSRSGIMPFLSLALPSLVARAADPGPFPGVRSQWIGYDRYDFLCDGRKSILVTPKEPAKGRPWVWRARFFGHQPQADLALLARGFHLTTFTSFSVLPTGGTSSCFSDGPRAVEQGNPVQRRQGRVYDASNPW